MKKILVPTDFSLPATHAMDLAVRLAKANGAEIRAIHSVDVPSTWQDARFTNALLASRTTASQHALYPEARERVGAARQHLEDLTLAIGKKGVKATYTLTTNTAWKEIIAAASTMRADLIVMGTQGAGAVKEAFMGSHAQRVIRSAAMPVITLREAPPTRIANIALLVDPADKGIDKPIRRVMDTMRDMRVRFHLVHVNTPNRFSDTDSILGQLHQLARRLDPTMRINSCAHYTVAEGGLAFARREGMDMIALVTHGRTAPAALFDPSVAETIANQSDRPVLTLRIG
jgi:nucleotide-binding universal stress UspA family protein